MANGSLFNDALLSEGQTIGLFGQSIGHTLDNTIGRTTDFEKYGANNALNYSVSDVDMDSEQNDSMTRTVSITLGAVTLYMFLVMTLMIYCRYIRAKRKSQPVVDRVTDRVESNKAENGDIEMSERNANTNTTHTTHTTHTNAEHNNSNYRQMVHQSGHYYI